MDKLRLRFKKTDPAIYISHLDQMKTIQRSFSRAGYELKYSEGFNPHPQISVALPMSLGTASQCEILDFGLRGEADLEKLPGELSLAMPQGLEVIECYEPKRKVKELKYLEVNGRLEYDEKSAGDMALALNEFYSCKELVVTKRTKRGESETDIMPLIPRISFSEEPGFVSLHAVISAQEPSLNPELLIDALRQKKPELSPDFTRFTRIETFDSEMRVFR